MESTFPEDSDGTIQETQGVSTAVSSEEYIQTRSGVAVRRPHLPYLMLKKHTKRVLAGVVEKWRKSLLKQRQA